MYLFNLYLRSWAMPVPTPRHIRITPFPLGCNTGAGAAGKHFLRLLQVQLQIQLPRKLKVPLLLLTPARPLRLRARPLLGEGPLALLRGVVAALRLLVRLLRVARRRGRRRACARGRVGQRQRLRVARVAQLEVGVARGRRVVVRVRPLALCVVVRRRREVAAVAAVVWGERRHARRGEGEAGEAGARGVRAWLELRVAVRRRGLPGVGRDVGAGLCLGRERWYRRGILDRVVWRRLV